MDTILQNLADKHLFPVAGIAAGSGGLDAIIKLISGIPENSAIAYVIMHQDSPEYPDNLSEVLSGYTDLPVAEIIYAVDFFPNHIYLVPSNSNLTAKDGILELHQRTRLDKVDESVDLFFASLSRVYNSAAIGIILSGTGFNGIEGFKKLKEIGAATIAQDPKTTLFREMPLSIITAELADYVQAPEHIAHLLKKVAQGFTETEAHIEKGFSKNERQEFVTKILDIILSRTGNDFRHYKQHLVRRRIAHRMISVNKITLHDYYAYLRHSIEEQDLLFEDLLIRVTGFFREAPFYDSLTSGVFPHLVQNTVNNSLRIWIPGCAAGQQAYSVAISLHEYLKQTNNEQIQVQIFASDLSVQSISQARKGVYTEQDLLEVSQSRLQNYFTKRNDGYHIEDVIRDMCVFTMQNVVKDRPFSRIDLICFSSVLPFFDVLNQNLALGAFHYALKEKGVLVLGAFESIINATQLFENFGRYENLYTPTIIEPISRISSQRAENSQKQLPKILKIKQENKFTKSNGELVSKTDELLIISDELRDRQKQLSEIADFAESIIQTIHEPVVLIDKNFIIKSANPAFYKYFRTVQKKTAGYSFFEIGNCQWNIAEFKAQIVKMQEDQIIFENFRVETNCEVIGKKIMNVSARPLQGSKSDGIFIIALQDITEINFVYELFDTKNLELQKYNELLQTFAVAATNNILDPLQKIQMLGKRIFDREMNLSESSSHNLQRILFASENMSKLIEGLILYSNISFLAKEYKRTDLNLIVKKNLSDLKNIIKQKKAVINVTPLPQLEVNPSQIQQLFTNIISNAIQYTRDDVQPEIHIDAQQPSVEEIIEIGGNPEISFAKISITDNGIGFDKRYETQIFDPFFRLHTNDQYSGSGLGLTLVKKIVNSHRGYVRALSKIHEGTKINIYIPLQQT